MKVLRRFHKSILDVRSHQWKYQLEPYRGCGMGCVYCGARRRAHLGGGGRKRKDLIPLLRDDLAGLKSAGITYISPEVDPYQPLEKALHVTRRALELFLEFECPVVPLTKSPLILRDEDLLLELHKRDLVSVQFTVLHVDPDMTRALEPGVALPRERLEAAARLAGAGIPVHFHISPYLPGLYRGEGLADTIRAIADHGGRCVYTNPLGLRRSSGGKTVRILDELNAGSGTQLLQMYPRRRPGMPRTILPRSELLLRDMEEFREICRRYKIGFVCEFIPELTDVDPAEFSAGVFRYGLPTVYDMLRFCENRGDAVLDWATFDSEFLCRCDVVDGAFRDFVLRLWESGDLFRNTRLVPTRSNGRMTYRSDGELKVGDHSQGALSWMNRLRRMRVRLFQ